MAIVVSDDSHFKVELANAGSKLVIVGFGATWCSPCLQMAPLFDELSRRYPNAVFLKVDVDECTETAVTYGISIMPTFVFYRNGVKICHLVAPDHKGLEAKVMEFAGKEVMEPCTGDKENEPEVKGHVDLSSFIHKSGCECLNDSDEHSFSSLLASENGYLESDCDDQLIMSFGFTQSVKLHSLKIQAPKENGPKTLKLFINQPHTLDFDEVDSIEAVQSIEIEPEDLELGRPIPLRYVKYQNVQNLQIFVKANQSKSDVTRIDHVTFIGSPVLTMKMSEFKRISGKKGESH